MIAKPSQASRKFLQALPLCLLGVVSAASAAPTQFWAQPAPSNSEQYLLELINIARANPTAEGQKLAGIQDPEILRYYSHYNVDTNKLRSDFAGYSAKPPLALNAKLMASARAQSLDQAQHGFQGHDGTDGSHFDQRISNQGYAWGGLGENVFAYVENPFFGHVGLMADWGVPSLDHRDNSLNLDPNFPMFKEVGISCVSSSIANFGPLVITEDFGAPADSNAAFLVGVIYNDLNHNGAYDEGEGLAGVTVMPDGGDYYTTTTASGGYQLPLPTGSGLLTITASGAGLGAPRVKTVRYVGATNVKVDFTPADVAGPVVPQVELSTVSADAAASANQVGVIVIKRRGNKSADLNVALKVGGTAISGVDYSALPDSVVIPAGKSSVSVTVSPLTDAFSGIKKVKVQAAPGSNYTVVSSGKGKVRILGVN